MKKKLLHAPILIIGAIVLFTATTGADEAKYLKDFPGGFALKEPVSFYNRNNLYEYINGQAVFYNSYGFSRLEHGQLAKGSGLYTVDVYELGSPLSAFGAFRQQREEDASEYAAGAECAVLQYLTTLYKDRFYVEIIPETEGSDDVGAMKELASWVEGRLPGARTIPPELSLFPAQGLTPKSERYVDESLISYSFMGRGLTALYKPVGQEKEFRVFIGFSPNQDKARAILTEFQGKMTNTQPLKSGDIAGVKGELPYRGLSIAFQYSSLMYGCMGISDEKQAMELLGMLGENLKKHASAAEKN